MTVAEFAKHVTDKAGREAAMSEILATVAACEAEWELDIRIALTHRIESR